MLPALLCSLVALAPLPAAAGPHDHGAAAGHDDAPEGDAEGAEGAAEEAPPAPVTWTIDPAQGTTLLRVQKDESTLVSGMSHDHVVVARDHSGSFTWNAADPSACRLLVRLPVARLLVDPPEVRAQQGLEGELSDAQREDVRRNMLSKDQLWASSHPFITFESEACLGDGDSFEMQGDLSIRGRSRSVILKGALTTDDAGFRIQGELRIRATDFGFEPYTAMFGQLKNQDQMTLVVDLGGSAR